MTDHFDDETQFWDKPEWIRTGQTPVVRRDRTGGFERTRSHRIVRQDDPPPFEIVSFEDFAPADEDVWDGVDHWVEPLEETHHRGGYVGVDPKLLRIGAVGLVGVLMIPIALALRDDGAGAADGVRSEQATEITGTVAAPLPVDPTTTIVTVPATAAVPAPAVTTPSPAPGNTSADRASQGIAAVAPVAPAEPACAGTYTVIANDFWNRFPRSSGASVEEWLAANDATADTPLYVGDELCIPAGATAPAPPPVTTQPPTTTAAPTTQAPTTTQAPATTAPPAPVVTTPPPTTRAPVAAAPPAVAAPPAAGATDPASVEALIREIWPDELEERALTIARRESGLRPGVSNYCCYGVFAIYFEMGRNFLPQMGITSAEQLFDARTNITAAYRLYTLAGWKPWSQTDPGS